MIQFSKTTQRLLLIVLVLSSLTLAILIFADWLPLLRGPAPETSEWYWPHSLRPFSRWLPSILVAGLLWAVSAWWLAPEQSTRRRNILAISGLIAASCLLQLALIYADRADVAAELVDRTLSNLASGFFEPAAEIENMADVLRDYPQQMPDFASEHAQTHPPGLIIANWLTIQAFSRWPAFAESVAQNIRPLRCTDLWLLNRPPQVAAALAFWSLLPMLSAALTTIPAFGLARLLLQGRARRLATILVATIPALLLFSPKSVQLYALLTLILFWVYQSAIMRKSLWRYFFAGTLLSLMTYLSLGNAALYMLLVLYAISLNWLSVKRQRKNEKVKRNSWLSLLGQLLLLSLGAAMIWLLTWLIWDIPPWAIAQVGLQQHYQLVTNIRRYDWWLIWNMIDLLLFAGWPLIVGFIGSFILTIKLWRQKQLQSVDVLTASILVMIVLLNISGSARGEVGRLWLFFIPLLAYPAARFWNLSLPGKRHAWIIVALQLLMVVTLGLSWRPVRAVIVAAQEPPSAAASPNTELDIAFISQPFSLQGYSYQPDQIHAGEQIELTLFWRAYGPAQRPYTVFNHLIDESGKLVAQQDSWSLNGQWPPTCWRAGDTIIDTYKISLPASLPPGSYDLHTGLYDAQTGERVRLQNDGDAFYLGNIFIQSP